MAAPGLGTLWIGGALGWLDRLALTSCLARGHEVTLFHVEDLEPPRVPGLRIVPAREVWDYPTDLPDKVTPAVFSDLFRLHMVRDAGLVWVDTDVLCWRPLVPDQGYLVGYEEAEWINGAVLSLPPGSEALNRLIALFEDRASVPEWIGAEARESAAAAPRNERLFTAARLVPNVCGPRALTWALNETGEVAKVVPQDVLYPVPWGLADIYFNPFGGVEDWLTDRTRAVHMFSSRIRRLHKRVGPYPGSFIARFAEEVGFDLSGLRPRR